MRAILILACVLFIGLDIYGIEVQPEFTAVFGLSIFIKVYCIIQLLRLGD